MTSDSRSAALAIEAVDHRATPPPGQRSIVIRSSAASRSISRHRSVRATSSRRASS
jgi:hypothetical protein